MFFRSSGRQRRAASSEKVVWDVCTKAWSTGWSLVAATTSKHITQCVILTFVPTLLFVYSILPDDVTPEILRCPLEQAVLRTKLLDCGEPVSLLALVMDPPRLDNIARTIMMLKEIGALKITTDGRVTPLDGDLTFLGRVASRLPIDVHLGKLIMLGNFPCF